MITSIYPHLIDIDTGHTPDFRFERQGVLSDSLIMCFRSSAMILTSNGMENAHSGDCIVHSPDFHLLHYSVDGAEEGFRNDWLYVKPEVLTSRMDELALPWNALIRTGEPEILTPYLKRLLSELSIDDELSNSVVATQIDDMLLTLARIFRHTRMLNEDLTAMERRYYHDFSQLRHYLQENCRRNFTLKMMADRVSLSPERFAVLYKQFFKATPYAEIIEARLILARRLLLSTNMTIKEIAQFCGWDDIHYFSRLFHKKSDVSPTQFRS